MFLGNAMRFFWERNAALWERNAALLGAQRDFLGSTTRYFGKRDAARHVATNAPFCILASRPQTLPHPSASR